MQHVIQTMEQQRFYVKLLRFDYIIKYKPEASHKVADPLSKKIM